MSFQLDGLLPASGWGMHINWHQKDLLSQVMNAIFFLFSGTLAISYPLPPIRERTVPP